MKKKPVRSKLKVSIDHMGPDKPLFVMAGNYALSINSDHPTYRGVKADDIKGVIYAGAVWFHVQAGEEAAKHFLPNRDISKAEDVHIAISRYLASLQRNN